MYVKANLNHARAENLTKIQIQNHTELAWILSCLTPVGRLMRMTTWKVSSPFSLISRFLELLRLLVQVGGFTERQQ